MKVPGARGSMGIPPAIHPDTLRQQREEAERRKAARPEMLEDDYPDLPPPSEDDGTAGEAEPSVPRVEDPAPKSEGLDFSPLETLKRLGVDLTPEDFNRLVFKGYITKNIPISYDPTTNKDVVGTFKTLTAQEIDEVDELLASEMKDHDMTVQGRESRHGTWILAFSLTHIDGMELKKPVMADGSKTIIDTKETAKSRVKIVRALSPYLVERAARAYNEFSVAIRLISQDPKRTYLKKP
jgi:hypothetical protein